jgi:putative radical SAM enzyme (TIGR03279 family)
MAVAGPRGGGAVREVAARSLAHRIGLQAGDRLLAVDGRPLRDAIDFRFYAAEERFCLRFARDGRESEIEVQRRPGEGLGVEFESAIFDRIRTCNNNCFFCFLKGLPRGLRTPLYLKDDDYRLSFAQGNFVTLSNLTDADWRRLEEQRLSPLNVSVHATDLELRRRTLGNRKAPDVVGQLRRLGELGIRVNTQVVLCPGLNDDEHLERTVRELAQLYPTVQSIGIVPVAASRHAWARAGDEEKRWLAACTPEYARQIIGQMRPWQRELRQRLGVDLVYLADEFYLAGGVRLPAARRYDGYPQYENGIGMTRALIEDWRRLRRRLAANSEALPSAKKMTLVCGTLIAPVLSSMASEMTALSGMETQVAPVENRLFGPRVTVSGLLAGGDIVEALRGRDLGDLVVMPRHSLDHAGALFLDGVTPDDVGAALATPVAFASLMSELLRL